MRLTYDAPADVFGLELSDALAARTSEEQEGVIVAYDRAGRVLGIQVLEASTRFEKGSLTGLAVPILELSLAEAAVESGLSSGTLRVLINTGRLTAAKRGRDWVVTAADLDNYLESRAASGRPAATRKARKQKQTTIDRRKRLSVDSRR